MSTLWVLCLLVASAFGARVQVSVDDSQLEVGQSTKLHVTVVLSGGDGRVRGVPQVAAPESVVVASLGPTSFTQTTRGYTVTGVRFDYSVKALVEGPVTIDPVSVVVGRDTLQTDPLVLEVLPASAPPETQIVAQAGFAEETAWEGQVILYRYEVRSLVDLHRSRWSQLASDSLVRPRDGGPVRRQYVIEHPDGNFLVDLTLDPVIVAGSGDLELAPAVVIIEIPTASSARRDPWGLMGRTTRKTLATEATTLKVRPLPPAPEGFSGLVGEFDFAGEVDETAVVVGDSVNWTIRVRGDGTLEGFSLPEPIDTEAARMYDGSPVVSGGVEADRYHAQGSYARVVVPTTEGALALPPLEVITFSPAQGDYVTHRIALPEISVKPGKEGSGEVESFAVEPSTSEPELDEGQKVHDAYASGWATTPSLFWLLRGAGGLGVMLGIYPVLLWIREAVQRWEARREARNAPPPATPSQQLAVLPADPEARLAALDGVLRAALAKSGAVDEGALERGAAIDGLPFELAEQVRAVVRILERARFAGEAPPDDLDARVRAVVRTLEAA